VLAIAWASFHARCDIVNAGDVGVFLRDAYRGAGTLCSRKSP
jgi:hypothetical protein